MATRMQQRRGTAAEWAAANPILADGELGVERDTGVIKVGDGATGYNALLSPFMFKSIFDAAGDILVGTADNTPSRLPVGATGTMLVADSTQAAKMAWSNVLRPTSAANIGLAVKGLAAQTGDLTQWQDSTGAVVARVAAAGYIFGTKGFAGGAAGFADAVARNQLSSNAVSERALVISGVAAQTADLTQWQNSGGTMLGKMDSGGGFWAGGVHVGNMTVSPGSNFSVIPTQPNVVAAIIRGATAQTADLLDFQSPTGSLMTYFDSNGYYHGSYSTVQGGGALTLAGDWSGAAASGYNLNQVGSGLTVRPNFSNYYGLLVQAQSAQTANLIQCASFSGANVGSDIMHVTPGGNVAGTGAYTTLSDISSKDNVVPLKRDPMNVINALRPVHYDYIDGETNQVGFIAHEVLAHLPEAIVSWDKDRLGLRTDAILAYLVGAVQQLAKRNPTPVAA